MSKFFSIYKILLRHFTGVIKDYLKNCKSNLRHLFTANLKEKITAFVLALFTFMYVRYQDVDQRNLFVSLQIDKIDELTFVNDLPKTVSLFVSGNKSALNNLDVNKIVARIDLTDITSPGVFQRSPILESLPEGVQVLRINPQNLIIELSNLEKKLLKIEPSIIGKPKVGYRIQSIQVSPSRLWVFGPHDILNDITKIETEPIEIDSLDQSKQIDVAFNKNIHPGLKFDRNRRLDVLINIESRYIQQNLVDPIEVVFQLTNDLILKEPLMVSNVSFEIRKDDVPTFNVEQDLVFYFNSTSIKKAGEYIVKIKFKTNKKIRSINYRPQEIKIDVINKGNTLLNDKNKKNGSQ